MNNISKSIKEIKKIPWKKGEYNKQNWGIWLHSISSYVGRLKPSFAHFLIKTFSNKGELVLDPFCGIGTIVLEADLLGRKALGVDLNPYACIISKAKFDRRGLENEIQFLKNLDLSKEKIDLKKLPSFVKEYYHPKTLKEIIALRDILFREKRFFLLGCLLGISHGHRPQHLSIKTGYIIPYLPNPRPKKEYRETIPRMIQKVKRMYKDPFPLKSQAKIFETDTRDMPIKENSVDVVITSPPYYDTLDYIISNKLRLAILGVDENEQEILRKELIQNRKDYLIEMERVADEVERVLKKSGRIIYVLGDVHLPKKSLNTAKDISEVYSKKGFIVHEIIEDEIPRDRSTISKFNGIEGINNKQKKMDRILIMTLK